MYKDKRRSCPRDKTVASILISESLDGNYVNAVMHNHSRSGMYIVAPQQLNCESGLYINMTDTMEQDVYRGFFGKVKWCRELRRSSDLNNHFGAGLHYIVKSHQYFGGIGVMAESCCDICGARMSSDKLIKTREYILECPSCRSALARYPDGNLKATINNYLMGNIL